MTSISTGTQRVFVVGTPRSGTTLLQSLIAAHPEVFSLPETHFFTGTAKPILNGRFAAIFRSPEKFAQAFLDTINMSEVSTKSGHFGLTAWLRGMVRPSLLARYYLNILDQCAAAFGKPIWVEKTPRHLHYLSWIRGAAERDSLLIVHMLRGHDATVRSISKASYSWTNSMDTTSASKRWESDLEHHARFLGLPEHVFVSYERLVADPYAVMATLFVRLETPYHQRYLDRRAEVASTLVRPDEHWKAKNLSREIGDASLHHKPDTSECLIAPSHQSVALYERLLKQCL